MEKYGVASKTALLAFEWQLLIDAKAACPGIGTDFLTIDLEVVKSFYRKKGTIRPEDMHLPLNPANHGNSLPKTIGAAAGEWWGPYIANVSADKIETAQDCNVKVNHGASIPMTKSLSMH